MSRSRSPSIVTPSGNVVRTALAKPTSKPDLSAHKTWSERLSAAVLGVKGSLLPDAQGGKAYVADENPMTRLKLLLVRSLFQDDCRLRGLMVFLGCTARVLPDNAHPQLLHDSHSSDDASSPP